MTASPPSRRRRAAALAGSAAVHAALLLAFVGARPRPAPVEDSPAVSASVVRGLLPASAVPAVAIPAPPPARAAAPSSRTRPTRDPPPHAPLRARDAPTPPVPQLTEAQLAGAAGAESGAAEGADAAGGGGGACNMAARLQAALRRDPLVRSAVAALPDSRARLVWNGDWVRSDGEDGKGLAAVREAILWEVGFAPAACRAAPVHGLVLIRLGEGPGAQRLALGAGDWRWSDLLILR